MSKPTDKEQIANLEQQIAAISKDLEVATQKVESFEQAQKSSTDRKLFVAEKVAKHFILGSKLKESLVKLLSGDTSKDNFADVLTAALYRFTRIGIFALVVAFIPIVILTMQTVLLSRQNDKLDRQNYRLDQQTSLLEADRRSAVILESGNVLDAISRELNYEGNIKDSLSNPLIGRIIALSRAMKPYKYLDPESDSIIAKAVSPERGHLLVSLYESRLDSITITKINNGVVYRKAELEAANLQNANLSRVNLYAANLKGVNFQEANLEEVYLREADMQWTDLTKANLLHAQLQWANLRRSILEEAYLPWAGLERADLREAYLRNANLERANLFEANLESSNLYGAKMYGAKLEGANLEGANLLNTDLQDADLRKTNLRNIKLQEIHLVTEDTTWTRLSGSFLQGAIANKESISQFLQAGADTTGMIWIEK